MSKPYHYSECGLDNVYLANGFALRDTPYGKGVSIANVDGLHKAIALDLIARKPHLGGKEIRFLRKQLDLSQQGLANFFGVSPRTVARWEKGQTEVPQTADRLLRLIYQDKAHRRPRIVELLEKLNDLDALTHDRRVFEEIRRRWRPAA